MHVWPANRHRTVLAAVAAGTVLTLGIAACGSSGGGSKSSQVPASAKQTIVFATQGLGSEGSASKAAVAAFEKANPKITVHILNLSPDSNVAYSQLQQRFISGANTPDVITSDVIWPATFAQAHWIADLSQFHPDTSAFFPGQMASGEFNGSVYGIPWFINAEGLYYRTDLIKTPPTTAAQVFTDAIAAMKKDHSLKEGLAFEGDKYEGAVTAFQSFGGQITKPDLQNIDTSQNAGVLTMMADAIHKARISPSATSTWEEANVQAAWQAGQTPFALNWPYLFALSEATGSKVAGKTGWIPFPSPVGKPQASLGGDDLVINAKSTHQAAAYKFIQYLTSDSAQIARAIAAGDPPSVKSAYTSALYAKAPYFKQETKVFDAAVARPVLPNYTQVSAELQTMISSVLSGAQSPSAALKASAPSVSQLLTTVGS